MANLMFNLLGKDVSASKALGGIHSKGKAVAAGVAGAFGGMAIGTMFAKSLAEGKIESQLNATMSGTPGLAKKVAEAAGENYRAGWGTSLEDNISAVKAVGKSLVKLGDTSPEDIKKISSSAMGLAKIMGTDVTNVTKAAGSMMKNGLAPDAKGALDAVANGMKAGANGGGDFLKTMVKFSPTFKKMGLDGNEAGALMAAGIKAGAPNATAVMKSYMTLGASVSSGSKKSGKALQDMGLNAAEMAKQMAKGGPSAKAASSTVIEALGKMKDPVKQQAAGVALFGIGWKTMGKDTVAALDPAKLKIDAVKGSAEAMGATLQDNTATKVESIKRTFEHLGVAAVSLPGPLGMIGAGVAALGPQGMAMASSMASAAGAIGNMGIAAKVTAVATKIWTAAQWLFNIAMDANPIMLIVIAIAALVAAFIILWNKCDWFRNFWIGLWDKIKAVASAVINAVKGFFSGLWDKIKAIVIAIYNYWHDKFNAIKTAVSTVIDAIKGFFSGLWDKIKAIVVTIYNWIHNRFVDVHNAVKGVIDAIKGFFSDLWDKVKTVFSNIYSWVHDKLVAVGNVVLGVVNSVKGFFSGLWDGIKSGVTGAVDVIKNIIGGIAGFFKNPINVIINGINWMIDKINSIHIKTPDLPGTDWGGQDIGFNIGHIPNLAKGGIIMPTPGGTLTRIGEAGHAEAVIPLNRGGLGNMGTTVNITVTGALVGDRDALAVAVRDAVKGAQRRGVLPAGAFS